MILSSFGRSLPFFRALFLLNRGQDRLIQRSQALNFRGLHSEVPIPVPPRSAGTPANRPEIRLRNKREEGLLICKTEVLITGNIVEFKRKNISQKREKSESERFAFFIELLERLKLKESPNGVETRIRRMSRLRKGALPDRLINPRPHRSHV